MRVIAGFMMLAAVLAQPLQSRAAEPLVDVAWVKANLGKPGIVFLDLRSAAGLQKSDYLGGHIPGAVYTDYAKAGWREKSEDGIEGQLPPPEKLEKLIGSLGIDNATHVVLVPYGFAAQEMAAATRVYWTFKVLGHDAVSILDGGFQAYAGEDGKTARPRLETADVKRSAKVFKARLRPEAIATVGEVKAAIDSGVTLIDNRPPDHFIGITKSMTVKRPGTLPGAKNIPESWLTENNGGYFRK
ncbi:MAG: sulfurtransferase, partial [Hyphomicrobiaceae bacterium]